MSPMLRGSDIVVNTLRQAGIHTIFTLSGNHVMPIFDSVIGTDVELIHVRHEGASVHMADAYARMTGKVGVALVTGGAGHANAMGALCTARDGETPVLLLSGHAPLDELGRGAFQELRQAEIAAPLAKASWTAKSAATLADDLAKGIRIARSGRPGPVHISLPSDVLEMQSPQVTALNFDAGAQPLPAKAAQDVIDLLRASERPLIIAPPALCTVQGRTALARLRRLGVPVIPMESPRGIKDPALGDVASLLRAADLVILLGKALDFTLKFGAATCSETCRWIAIEPDAGMLERTTRTLKKQLALQAIADPNAAINALQGASDPPIYVASSWVERVTNALARRPPSSAASNMVDLNSASMCAAINDYLRVHEDAIFISDGGEIGQWAQALISTQTRIINGVAGAIGPSIPFALGAKVAARGRPVLAVMGDGTFGFHMAEFDTAVRHNLPFVAVIGNDARWNAEHQLQIRKYGVARATGCDLRPATRYDMVVAALGGYGELVTSLVELVPALNRAFSSGKPACLNVLINGLPAPSLEAER